MEAMQSVPVTWISPAMAARQLGVTPQMVSKLIRQQRLRAVQTALGHLIDPASVDKYELERRQRKAPQWQPA